MDCVQNTLLGGGQEGLFDFRELNLDVPSKLKYWQYLGTTLCFVFNSILFDT